jgi:hypothetical protein
MLFRERVAVYCENHMQHTNTFCGQNADILNIISEHTYKRHWALKREFERRNQCDGNTQSGACARMQRAEDLEP